ncbi:unnamed protein product [Linum trigynum]|uniref:Uncharacterized protein n=1 Tax=Linum trigynum TaxID=586398 RepID=A0AAV2DYU1_9ROSI
MRCRTPSLPPFIDNPDCDSKSITKIVEDEAARLGGEPGRNSGFQISMVDVAAVAESMVEISCWKYTLVTSSLNQPLSILEKISPSWTSSMAILIFHLLAITSWSLMMLGCFIIFIAMLFPEWRFCERVSQKKGQTERLKDEEIGD